MAFEKVALAPEDELLTAAKAEAANAPADMRPHYFWAKILATPILLLVTLLGIGIGLGGQAIRYLSTLNSVMEDHAEKIGVARAEQTGPAAVDNVVDMAIAKQADTLELRFKLPALAGAEWSEVTKIDVAVYNARTSASRLLLNFATSVAPAADGSVSWSLPLLSLGVVRQGDPLAFTFTFMGEKEGAPWTRAVVLRSRYSYRYP